MEMRIEDAADSLDRDPEQRHLAVGLGARIHEIDLPAGNHPDAGLGAFRIRHGRRRTADECAKRVIRKKVVPAYTHRGLNRALEHDILDGRNARQRKIARRSQRHDDTHDPKQNSHAPSLPNFGTDHANTLKPAPIQARGGQRLARSL
jgi:hypothetical protein